MVNTMTVDIYHDTNTRSMAFNGLMASIDSCDLRGFCESSFHFLHCSLQTQLDVQLSGALTFTLSPPPPSGVQLSFRSFHPSLLSQNDRLLLFLAKIVPLYFLFSPTRHSAFLSVGKVTVKSEYTGHSGIEWPLMCHKN